MSYTLKHGSTIGTAKVISNDLLPKGRAIPARKLNSIGSVTLHMTGNTDVKANNYHRALKNQNALPDGRQASWTYVVDDVEIYQEVPDNWETWHSGTSTGNKNSIGIEMCMWSNKERQRKTYDNSARLVAMLLKKHNLKPSDIKQHYDWSKKDCPLFLRHKKYDYDWTWFKNLVKKYYNETASGSIQNTNSMYVVDADVLNVRDGRGSEFKKVGTLTKGQKIEIWSVAKSSDNADWGSFRYSTNPDIIGFVHMGYLKKV